MSKAIKNNTREIRRRAMSGDIPNSTKVAASTVRRGISVTRNGKYSPTKPLPR